jgi:hypothetical protein
MRKGVEVLRGPVSWGGPRLLKEKQGAIGGESGLATESASEGFAQLHEWITLLAMAGFTLEQTAFEQPKETNSTCG